MPNLVKDPVDHWVDLDVQNPRLPLRREMYDAFDLATISDGPARAYWTGVATGYAVGFGLFTRSALDRAKATPFARLLNPLEDAAIFDDGDRAWACGVLYGYQQGTSERPDASECVHCGQRLTDDDEADRCEHGAFCPDCAGMWHRSLPGFCTYLDAA